MKKSEKQEFLEIIAMRNDELVSTREELVEVYKCLYPNYEFIIEKFAKEKGISTSQIIGQGGLLYVMRKYHKEQLEKEKLKKIIKEIMEEN